MGDQTTINQSTNYERKHTQFYLIKICLLFKVSFGLTFIPSHP